MYMSVIIAPGELVKPSIRSFIILQAMCLIFNVLYVFNDFFPFTCDRFHVIMHLFHQTLISINMVLVQPKQGY